MGCLNKAARPAIRGCHAAHCPGSRPAPSCRSTRHGDVEGCVRRGHPNHNSQEPRDLRHPPPPGLFGLPGQGRASTTSFRVARHSEPKYVPPPPDVTSPIQPPGTTSCFGLLRCPPAMSLASGMLNGAPIRGGEVEEQAQQPVRRMGTVEAVRHYRGTPTALESTEPSPGDQGVRWRRGCDQHSPNPCVEFPEPTASRNGMLGVMEPRRHRPQRAWPDAAAITACVPRFTSCLAGAR